MGRADVTISEKYRRILEAYQVEMDYGRTIEAYEGELAATATRAPCSSCASAACAALPDARRERDRLLGRGAEGWVVDDAYAASFEEGIGVAKKARAPRC